MKIIPIQRKLMPILIQNQKGNVKEINPCKKGKSQPQKNVRITTIKPTPQTQFKNQLIPVPKNNTQNQQKQLSTINNQNSQKLTNTNNLNQPKPIPYSPIQIQSDTVNYPIAILLGAPGVGKTVIMHKLFPKEKNIQEFTLYKLLELKYNFVDTAGFDFERDIDWREAQIKKFQEFFIQFDTRISSIFIVVNFERTDLMKKKLISVYKYFRKFTNLISIIVTDFHLSESNEDEENLRKSFKIFQPNDVLFVRGDVKSEELTNQLKKQSKMLKKIDQSNQFNLKDTIFEQEDLEEQKITRNKLLKMINR